jgi:hypothetical protein
VAVEVVKVQAVLLVVVVLGAVVLVVTPEQQEQLILVAVEVGVVVLEQMLAVLEVLA